MARVYYTIEEKGYIIHTSSNNWAETHEQQPKSKRPKLKQFKPYITNSAPFAELPD